MKRLVMQAFLICFPDYAAEEKRLKAILLTKEAKKGNINLYNDLNIIKLGSKSYAYFRAVQR